MNQESRAEGPEIEADQETRAKKAVGPETDVDQETKEE